MQDATKSSFVFRYTLYVYPYRVYTNLMHGIHKDTKKMEVRIKKIIGQLQGVEHMIQKDTYCIDIITQTSAIKSAISSLEDAMLESHLGHCLQKITDKKRLGVMKEEILKVYKLKRK